MAIPKKGARRIVVDGVEYRWSIRRKPTYVQLIWGEISLAVNLVADASTSTLVVHVPYDRPDSIGNHPVIIRPRDVAEAIRSALNAGWQPTAAHGPFHHTITIGKTI